MTALELGAATRVFIPPTEPFSDTPFGDVTLVPSVDPYPVTTFEGHPATPLLPDEYIGASTVPAANATGNHAIFVAIANLSALLTYEFSQQVLIKGGTETLVRPGAYDPGSSDLGVASYRVGLTTNRVSDPLITMAPITVLGVAGDGTTERFATAHDGVLGSSAYAPNTTPGEAGFGFLQDWQGDPADNLPLILGVWEFEDVAVGEQDLLDTLAAIHALFVTPEPAFTLGNPTRELTVPDTAGDVSTIVFGDIEYTPLGGNQTVAEAWEGGPLGFAAAYTNGGRDWSATGLSVAAPERQFTVFVALSGLSGIGPDQWLTPFQMGVFEQVQLSLRLSGIAYLQLGDGDNDGYWAHPEWEWPEALTDDLVVVAFTVRDDGTYEVRTGPGPAWATGASESTDPPITTVTSAWAQMTDEGDPYLLGMWEFSDHDGTTADIVATIAAIRALFIPDTRVYTSAELAFGAEFHVGAARVNGIDDALPAELELESGGAVIPPEAPTPAVPDDEDDEEFEDDDDEDEP